MKRALAIAALAGVLIGTNGYALADDKDRVQERDQEQVYGSQLMTRQERTEYHSRMRTAKSPEEREQIRKEHHERMKARAKERGVTLPDEPPARGGGMMDRGGGMGPGGGRGSGMGGGRP